jgi:hypothetical protein
LKEDLMKQRHVSRLRLWYRFVRRRSRSMRRICIIMFSVVLIASRVLELAMKLANGDGCT